MPGATDVYEPAPVSVVVAEAREKQAKINTRTRTTRPTPAVHVKPAPVCRTARLHWRPSVVAGRSVISVSQFSTEALILLFAVAGDMRGKVEDRSEASELIRQPPLRGRVLATLFFESSTRTACSFQAAMLRLGGTFLSVDAASSSVKKGETLEDTVISLLSYCDAIALRHPAKGAARAAAGVARGPVLNAGDGIGEHPTQALLDLYTIVAELGGRGKEGLLVLEGKVIAMVGDLKHGRTVHSLSPLLSRFKAVLRYVSPKTLAMPQSVQQEVVAERGGFCDAVVQTEHEDLDEVVKEADVLYITRMQKERFASREEFDAVNGSYCITPEVMSKAKRSAVLMHPLPRVGEIAEDCDLDGRAAYFRQMENGMFVRMALLTLLFGKA